MGPERGRVGHTKVEAPEPGGCRECVEQWGKGGHAGKAREVAGGSRGSG